MSFYDSYTSILNSLVSYVTDPITLQGASGRRPLCFEYNFSDVTDLTLGQDFGSQSQSLTWQNFSGARVRCFVEVGLTMLVSLGVGWTLDLLGFGVRSDFEIPFLGFGVWKNT